MPHRRKVALLIETSNTYARELLHGIRAWLREQKPWNIRLSEQGRGAGLPGWLAGWRGDGIIARVTSRRMASALRDTGLPVVDVAAALPEPVFPRVATDSRAATRLALDHLMERGFRHFAYCGDERFWWSGLREQYFEQQVRATGRTCGLFRLGKPRVTADGEQHELVAWLRELPKPVGILTCYDVCGQQVLEACSEAELAVPEQVAVIGVHNDELLCDLCEPPLTSVIPNARRAGYEAASLLARLMEGERVPVEARLIEPVGVAQRQSTDVVAVNDPKVSAAVRFIRANVDSGIDVSDVLRAVPMSRTLLERRFKSLLGHTPHEHILRTRLARVRAMLVETDLPVALIAERTGFEHTEYLSVAFRRETGLTPSAYRQRHRR
ncbi:DNA-binding transcriptional regulator [Oleiharenicola lentus]|uniref:DNA-binding transcriptional regulator n=1 Tax=Oleiharenicola lentus TaxID=2508720 RepID=A0A4Q1CBP1_9BACT|nr:DNA-binding transcriptional regulator [Oleiharenicola lentus]RXK56336.1 DNA-binding transcriptional regulator [Oleiharenicola lentus]